MTFTCPNIGLTLIAATLALSLAACSKKDDQPAATQVAVKVGSEEISVHQINQVLQRTNTAGATPEAVQKLSREVLEKLIDQQLAIDQATEAKLHRSPEVVAQIEAARRDILARAYLQKLTASLPKPSPEEAKTYIAAHPQLFAERRIYSLREIVVPPKAGTESVADQFRSLLAAGKTIDDIAAALKVQGIAFNSGNATRTAEQLPLDMLAQLASLKDGQSLVVEAAQSATLVTVVASQLAPVAEAMAMPRVEQFLANQRAGEAITADIKRLRSATPITYMGEFDSNSASSATATSKENAAPDPISKGPTAIEKGVAGLK
ncbi:MAG: peptidyl-prolyl cis-trans isomerase, EpsD family [Rhodoferax ferrireducens]|uniref:Peptidyl-prolyl cis-trans isomerase, EpsD family n=1 Tax=Rhodoferax ferrireducens TaxID=192843 RepID=A0A1W9KNI7_9BURK|nr:MAG: peptidyl-prolyl cis-trans isomerase, EpsD family [Rhodoferax ferrireducens]